MEAEQLPSKKCSSSRILFLLSFCFYFPRNIEMNIPGLGSLLLEPRPAQSQGLACSKGLPASPAGKRCWQPNHCFLCCSTGHGRLEGGLVSSAAHLAAEGTANRRKQDHSMFSGFQDCHWQASTLCFCDTG